MTKCSAEGGEAGEQLMDSAFDAWLWPLRGYMALELGAGKQLSETTS